MIPALLKQIVTQKFTLAESNSLDHFQNRTSNKTYQKKRQQLAEELLKELKDKMFENCPNCKEEEVGGCKVLKSCIIQQLLKDETLFEY